MFSFKDAGQNQGYFVIRCICT